MIFGYEMCWEDLLIVCKNCKCMLMVMVDLDLLGEEIVVML